MGRNQGEAAQHALLEEQGALLPLVQGEGAGWRLEQGRRAVQGRFGGATLQLGCLVPVLLGGIFLLCVWCN